MPCPLCGATDRHPSWLGELRYAERTFPYSECGGCGSSYCDPMPTDEVVREMYGVAYMGLPPSDLTTSDPKTPERVVAELRRMISDRERARGATDAPGRAGSGRPVFMDYGCGTGSLLVAAAGAGWRAVGVEYDPEVARRVTERTGLDVFPVGSNIPLADVLHLGDVIEHLTKMDEQLPAILALLRPGGTLIAQGPLEANRSLFTEVLKTARRFRRGRNTEMPPYHVLLATARGQFALFERFDLEATLYDVTEVDWPAPSRLAPSDLGRPRALGLFVLRRISRAVTALASARPRPASVSPAEWGNRYFYAGRKGERSGATTSPGRIPVSSRIC